MKEVQFSINIGASKVIVWDTLWQDETFREWASIIDPGTYMVGNIEIGNEIQFISAENGYGVISLVESIVPHEFLVLRHHSDTQESGAKERDKQWTGGKEKYELKETSGVTTLTVSFDVPDELEAYFNEAYPKALEKVKELAEAKNIS